MAGLKLSLKVSNFRKTSIASVNEEIVEARKVDEARKMEEQSIQLDYKVGTMIEMVMMFRVFMRTLRLLLTIAARASIRLARMLEYTSA